MGYQTTRYMDPAYREYKAQKNTEIKNLFSRLERELPEQSRRRPRVKIILAGMLCLLTLIISNKLHKSIGIVE
jgi:hypothetical protein